MIKEYGVKDTKAEELLAIDFENLEDDGPVHGLIFISEYVEEPLPKEWSNEDPDEDNIVFTSQVVTNACGTLALLNVLLNSEIEEKGDILNKFNNFTEGFSSVNRGLCLGNSDEIRRIHNAYSPATHKVDNLILSQTSIGSAKKQDKEIFTDEYEKTYHFISYIYKNGFIWELDGLKKRPYKITKCNKSEWLKMTEPIIQSRMQNLENTESGLEFSLLAIRHDNYEKMVADNEILKSNIHSLNSICNKNTPLSLVKEEAIVGLDGFPSLQAAWKDVEAGALESVKPRLDILSQDQLALDSRVSMVEENRILSRDNVLRQKFDYFSFIDTLVRKAFKRGLLEEPEAPKPKRRRKASAEKATTKRNTRTKK
ncbi:ubiquitin carboxyl-terminal hydrolase [Thamnidium elegans]|nr:ubiquitin carboxyl-terminal hydrolase [Thamnidium elegans]